jgi:hypothetical protein
MQLTQLGAVIVALGVVLALAVVVWRGRARRLNRENPQERYRRDIEALQRRRRIPMTGVRTEDVWEAGAAQGTQHSRAKKAGATLTAGLIGGCGGGCGGCGCGG